VFTPLRAAVGATRKLLDFLEATGYHAVMLGQILTPIRAWWYLRIATNATIPPDVGRYVMALRDRNQLAIEEIELQKQDVINKGAAAGKTVSTEAVLQRVLELKTKYDGPNREEYVSEVDRLADEFRKEHGPQIPVNQAYAMVKEIEARFGRAE
jgi:hypothetical protein